MNIAFDSTAVFGPMSKNRGIGNYALSQFKTIIERDPGNQYYLFDFFDDVSLKEQIPFKNYEEIHLFCGKDSFLLGNPEYREVFGDLVKKLIRTYGIDVYYITSPFDNHFPVYRKEWFRGVATVATVYDIIPFVFRSHYFPNPSDMDWYLDRIDMLRWVNRSVVISQSVKDDMVKYLRFDSERVDVIWGACADRFQKQQIEPDKAQALFSRYGIQAPFVMCTGGDDERKNLAGLITAFSKLSQDLTGRFQLVIVCKLSEPSRKRYTGIIQDCGLDRRVILTGFVTDEELVALYNLAHLLAFPSKYEGLGLPVLEAFSCGTPVLTGNNSSLSQIAGDAAVLVDSGSVDDIAWGLREALTNTDLGALVKKGYERLRQFTWEVVADESIKSIRLAAASGRPAQPAAAGKQKIAFFTPLPPLESGISDYSVDILNALCQYFDIDVFIEDDYEPSCKLGDNIHVYSHREFREKCRNYYDIIYQIGNSNFHLYMFPYLHRHGGTVVLHDYNMHGLFQFIALAVHNNDYDLYRKFLQEDCSDWEIAQYLYLLSHGLCGIRTYQMQLNGYVTNYADKVIVHSDYARKKLLQKNIGVPVQHIPLYANIEPLVDSAEKRKQYGFSRDDLLFCSFGHIHETKRAVPILKAFGRLCRKHGDARLVFAGKLSDSIQKEFNECLEEDEILQNQVNITGYVTLDQFNDYIDITDVCLNLRYPYNGETSGSLMRVLAKGKCVLVSDIGSFGEIPDECCAKIPSSEDLSEEEEVDRIYQAMEALAENRERRQSLAAAARKYAEENLDVHLIAKQYANFICSSVTPSLNEKMMSHIRDEIRDHHYSREEIQKLSRTLALSKELS